LYRYTPLLRTPAEAAMMKAMLTSSFGGGMSFYPVARGVRKGGETKGKGGGTGGGAGWGSAR
jgi:hypothetical protein